MGSPLKLFNFLAQFILHLRQNVKWLATELLKSGYLQQANKVGKNDWVLSYIFNPFPRQFQINDVHCIVAAVGCSLLCSF